MAEYQIGLNLESTQLDAVSQEIAAALTKISNAAKSTATSSKPQDITLDLSKTFKPLDLSIKTSILALTGFSGKLTAVGKELDALSKRLTALVPKSGTKTETTTNIKATGSKNVDLKDLTVDTSGIGLVLKGSKEITLLANQISVSEILVNVALPEQISVKGRVLVPKDIEIKLVTPKQVAAKQTLQTSSISDEIKSNISVKPIELTLKTKLQEKILEGLTVAGIELGSTFGSKVSKLISDALSVDSISLDLSESVKQLSADLNLEINNAGEDFNISKSLTIFQNEINSAISNATTAISQLNVAPSAKAEKKAEPVKTTVPKAIAVKGLLEIPKSIQVKVLIDKEISVQGVLVSKKTIDVDLNTDEIKSAVKANIVPVAIELEDLITGKITVTEAEIDLSTLVSGKIKLTNPEITVEATELKLKTLIQSKVKESISVEEFSIDLSTKIKTAVAEALTIAPINVDISSAVATFESSIKELSDNLQKSASKLTLDLSSVGSAGEEIKSVVSGFISATVTKLKNTLAADDVDELATVIKQVKAASKADTSVNLTTEVNKLQKQLATEFQSAGNAIELSEAIKNLNAAIKSEVNKSGFDFKTETDRLNKKLAESVDTVNFNEFQTGVDLIQLAVSSLFKKIEQAISEVKSPKVDNSNNSGINTAELANLQRVLPLINKAQAVGEISPTGKLNGATKEGKARTSQVTEKNNLVFRALSSLDVDNIGRTEAETIANLVRELENVYEDLTKSTQESVAKTVKLANEIGVKSDKFNQALATERSSAFQLLEPSKGLTAQIRVRKPNENSKINPNNTEITGGTPKEVRSAGKALAKETEELAFDLRILNKEVARGNTDVAKSLSNFSQTLQAEAKLFGVSIEKLAEVDPGRLRDSLQALLSLEGVKFTADAGLGFNAGQIKDTEAESMSGIGGMVEVLANLIPAFIDAQLGKTPGENGNAVNQITEAGKEFSLYAVQAGKELYSSPTTKAAAASIANLVKNSALLAADTYRSAKRIEDAVFKVSGPIGGIAKFGIQAVAAQATLGNFGLGDTGSFLGEGVSSIAQAAGGLAKSNTDAFGAGLTIDVLVAGIKAAAPLIGLGIATGITTKAIDQAIPDRDPKITALESKVAALAVQGAKGVKGVVQGKGQEVKDSTIQATTEKLAETFSPAIKAVEGFKDKVNETKDKIQDKVSEVKEVAQGVQDFVSSPIRAIKSLKDESIKVDVIKPEEQKQNEKKVAREEAKTATNTTEKESTKGKIGKREPKTLDRLQPFEGEFSQRVRAVNVELKQLAITARTTGNITDVNRFEDTAKTRVAQLRGNYSGNTPQDSELNLKVIKAIADSAQSTGRGLNKNTIREDFSFSGRSNAESGLKRAEESLQAGAIGSARKNIKAVEQNLENARSANEANDGVEIAIDPELLSKLSEITKRIDQKELQLAVKDLQGQIQESRVSGKADIQKLSNFANLIKKLPASESGIKGNELLLSIGRLETSIKGVTTKDFKEGLKIASLQSGSGDFEGAERTLSNARGLASGKKESLEAEKATKGIFSSELARKFKEFEKEITNVDLTGATKENVAALRDSAKGFNEFPELALKIRNKVNKLEAKIPKDTSGKDNDNNFTKNLNLSQSELSVSNFDSAKEFLKVAQVFATTLTQQNAATTQGDKIDAAVVKTQVAKIDQLINVLKAGKVTKEGVGQIRGQVGSVNSDNEQNKLRNKLNSLEKSIPKVKESANPFGELISALKKEFDLKQAPSEKDRGDLLQLADTRGKKASAAKFLAEVDAPIKPKKVKPEKNQFPEQLALVNARVRNGRDLEGELEKLQGLAKTKKEAEQVLSVLKKIEQVTIDKAFVKFKQEAFATLNTGNKISKSQAAFLTNEAGQFKGTSSESAADKIVRDLAAAINPFKGLSKEIQAVLSKGNTPAPGKLTDLSRLANNDIQRAEVKEIREKTKEVSLQNEFNQFTESIAQFKNNNETGKEAAAEIFQAAQIFKGTKFETQANTSARKFSEIKDGGFNAELRLQEVKKSSKLPVDLSKLNQLANTELEKALVLKLKGSIDKSNLDGAFKEFTDLIQKAINDIKTGETNNGEILNQITQSLDLFEGTDKQTAAETNVLTLQSVAEGDQNRKFKNAKTSVTQGLDDADAAVDFLNELSTGAGKLANQAKGFLNLQESSSQLKDFRDQIVKVSEELTRKKISPSEAGQALNNIDFDFQGSSVKDNKAIASQLFAANSRVIAGQSGDRSNQFTLAGQKAKLGNVDEAITIYKELGQNADSIGNQANIALQKLQQVIIKLTKEEENALKLLNAEFANLKSAAKVSGNKEGLQRFSNKVGGQSPEGSELFKSKFSKLQSDAAFTLQTKEVKAQNQKEKSVSTPTDFLSSLQLLSGSFRNVIDSANALAQAASTTSITLSKLEIANKGAIGQTQKDIGFAKSQQTNTGIAQQKTLQDLASFKLAIPSQDKLDSNGNKITQAVGSPEVERILKGLQSAGTANQLTGDEQSGANNAVLQILSKGQVQSEELKRQLANFLPGTVSTFAESQGINTSELETRLKRGEVGIDSLVDFADTLQKKFGSISSQNTPIKAVNTLSGNLEDIRFKSANAPGAVLQGALGVANPLVAGLKESAGTLAPIGTALGLSVGVALGGELIKSVDKNGTLGRVLAQTAGQFVLSPENSFKEQAFAGKFSTLGKVAGLTLGAGILSSVAVAITGAGGLDDLFSKAAKNLKMGLDGVFKGLGPAFGKPGEEGKAQSKVPAELVTQVLPTALLGIAAIEGGVGAFQGIQKRREERKKQLALPAFEVDNFTPRLPEGQRAVKPGVLSNVSGLVGGLASNPLTAATLGLAASLATYAVANTNFTSEFATESAKNRDELARNTAELRVKAGKTGEVGKTESTDKGAFDVNVVKGRVEDDRDLRLGDFNKVSSFGLRRAVEDADKAVSKGDESIKRGFFGESRISTKDILGAGKAELAARDSGKESDGQGSRITDGLFDKSLEAAVANTKNFSKNLEDIGSVSKLTALDLADLGKAKSRLEKNEQERKNLIDSEAANPEEQRKKDRRLTTLSGEINADRKTVNEFETKGLKGAVSNTDKFLRDKLAEKELFVKETGEKSPDKLQSKKFKDQIAVFDSEIEAIKGGLKTAQTNLKENSPAQKLADAQTTKENGQDAAERKLNRQQLALSERDKQSTLKRLTEGNDRDLSVRSAGSANINAKIEQTATQSKLEAAKALEVEIQKTSIGDEGDEKIKAIRAEIRQLELENEKKKGEIAQTRLQERIAIEARSAEELERKRTKQQRSLDTKEAQGNANNISEPNFQFSLNSVRLAESAAVRNEQTAKTQVKEQANLVKNTTVGKEAAQDKLDDLRVSAAQKVAARVAANRARQEAEENRRLEVAEFNTAGRGRVLANQNSVASRVQSSFSGADAVIQSRLTENANVRNASGASIDIEKQADVLSKTRFGREQQFQKLEDLKAAKVQKDTDFYLSQLARVRAEYEQLANAANSIRDAKNAVLASNQTTSELGNNVKFQNATQSKTNDLANTDQSALNDKEKIKEAQANFAAQQANDRLNTSNSVNNLNQKLIAGQTGVQVPQSAAQDISNFSPSQLDQIGTNLTKSLVDLEAKKLANDPSAVKANIGAATFETTDAQSIKDFIEFIQSLKGASQKRETDKKNIGDLERNASNASKDRSNNALRETDNLAADTKFTKQAEVNNLKSIDQAAKDRAKIFSTNKENSAESSGIQALSAFRQAKSDKDLADNRLRRDALVKTRKLEADQGVALAAGQGAEANQIGKQLQAEKDNLNAKLNSANVAPITGLVDNLLSSLKAITGDELKIINLREEQISRERAVFELRKSIGLVGETDRDAARRDITQRVEDSNRNLDKAKISLKSEQTPAGIIKALEEGVSSTTGDSKSNKIARQGLELAKNLVATGNFNVESISKLRSALDGLGITTSELAEAIAFSDAKIGNAQKIASAQSLSDLAESNESLDESNNVGRFSGIVNTGKVNRNAQSKIDREFAITTAQINADQFAEGKNLTPEKAQIFQNKRDIAKNTKSQKQSQIKTESRQISEDIAGSITANLKFDQFFKDIVSGTSVGEAAAKIGESIFDGLANYFSQKAQKSLNDILGSFFENLFDSIFGVVKDKAKESSKTAAPEVAKSVVDIAAPLELPTALSMDSPLMVPPSLATLAEKPKTSAPDFIGSERSIFSPYHPDNQFKSEIKPGSLNNSELSLDTVGLSQAEGDLSIVPELTDNRGALEMNTEATLQLTAALGSGAGGENIAEGLTGVDLEEDKALKENLPTSKTREGFEMFEGGLKGLTESLDKTKEPVIGFGQSLLGAFGKSGGDAGGAGLGLLGGLLGGFSGGEDGMGTGLLAGLIPSFADGDIQRASSFPKTPTKDLRERGADSRLAVLNSNELVVPAYRAQDFLEFSSNQSKYAIDNATTNNNRSDVNNNQSYQTNNNQILVGSTFGRSESANTVINDRVGVERKRFNQ